ncbi:MAG TPA: NAD(P)H-binding protein [Ohtaekwangia sp.]|nr:NAD(P)H-binding protein [Ohtaekwangia sp.]
MALKIAFIGATGMVGRPVAKELAYAGMEVTALVRDPLRAKDLSSAIALMPGDLRHAEDLDRLFMGKDAVYLNLNLDMSAGKNSYHNEREGLDTIIRAAQKRNLKRIALVSSLVMNYQGMNGFNWWVFDMKRQAVEKIRASGIPYTIFYPSTFMENFENNYRRGKKIMLAGTSHHRMYFIAGEDYGKQVSRSFQILNDENREYVIQGPEGFTAEEAAAEYIRHYPDEPLSIARAPAGMLQFLGYFNQRMRYGYHIVTALNNYPEKFESQTTWDELGKPSITLRRFAGRSRE